MHLRLNWISILHKTFGKLMMAGVTDTIRHGESVGHGGSIGHDDRI